MKEDTGTVPEPVLVGAFEESPAGFGLVDYTRGPLELYAAGSVIDSGICP